MFRKLCAASRYFTKGEKGLWLVSVSCIVLFFFIFDRKNILTLCASVIGVTALIFNAKGNPFGQFLIVVFSALYGMISYAFAYYGEMITYLGMTAPMAVFAWITWLKHPYDGNRAEVRINRLKGREILWMAVMAALVTFVFYFTLDAFHTANMVPSTISVTTSFVAVWLTYKRSPLFALAYAANDIVLVVLWVLASLTDISYISVTICFLIFLVNDVYGFVNWLKIQKRQERTLEAGAGAQHGEL